VFNIPPHLKIKWKTFCRLLASARPSEPEPTQKDYQDFLNQFNYIPENYEQQVTPLKQKPTRKK
jgi:hypothetical protein